MARLPQEDRRIILASNGVDRLTRKAEIVRRIPGSAGIHRGLGKRTGSFADVTLSAPEVKNPLLNIVN